MPGKKKKKRRLVRGDPAQPGLGGGRWDDGEHVLREGRRGVRLLLIASKRQPSTVGGGAALNKSSGRAMHETGSESWYKTKHSYRLLRVALNEGGEKYPVPKLWVGKKNCEAQP